MKCITGCLVLFLLAALSGCGSSGSSAKGKADDHDHDHEAALTEKDVKMPDSFKAGVARQEELYQELGKFVEKDDMDKAHRQAEEMALVAQRMKKLAQDSVAEDKLASAGRLCNELSDAFRKLDDAIHAKKKQEVKDQYQKMGKTIAQLKELAP
jgi:hypothetical protein